MNIPDSTLRDSNQSTPITSICPRYRITQESSSDYTLDKFERARKDYTAKRCVPTSSGQVGFNDPRRGWLRGGWVPLLLLLEYMELWTSSVKPFLLIRRRRACTTCTSRNFLLITLLCRTPPTANDFRISTSDLLPEEWFIGVQVDPYCAAVCNDEK